MSQRLRLWAEIAFDSSSGPREERPVGCLSRWRSGLQSGPYIYDETCPYYDLVAPAGCM